MDNQQRQSTKSTTTTTTTTCMTCHQQQHQTLRNRLQKIFMPNSPPPLSTLQLPLSPPPPHSSIPKTIPYLPVQNLKLAMNSPSQSSATSSPLLILSPRTTTLHRFINNGVGSTISTSTSISTQDQAAANDHQITEDEMIFPMSDITEEDEV